MPVKRPTRQVLATALTQPQILAFLPALTLGAYWTGGEGALLATALFVPVLYALAGLPRQQTPTEVQPTDGVTGLPFRTAVEAALEDVLSHRSARGMTTAALAVSVEGLGDVADRFGAPAVDLVMRRVADRLAGTMRGADTVARLDGAGFAVALGPVRRADLETLLQISGRIQDAVREPISVDAMNVYVSCSVGFCLPARSPAPRGDKMLEAAEIAVTEARNHGPGAIRAFATAMQSASPRQNTLDDEVAHALETGQLRPWFQPQISTDTGEVTGFEALARWTHPDRGLVPPAEFLPAIESAGLSERLSEEMLFHALSALRSWDRAGLKIDAVGVNFAADELRDTKLGDRIKWELDRFDLTPDRLSVGVRETVISETGDDMVSRNLTALRKLGCIIDLDDFGTGQVSIAALRRYAISRLKIDRCFIAHVNDDRDQQDMVAAILTMSERLGLDTVANGVESLGEHAMLSQLGCGHVQGFAIARPMPFEETIAWVRKHSEKLQTVMPLSPDAG